MSDNKVVRWASSMFIDPIGSYVTYHDYMMLKEERDRLRAELAEAKESARTMHAHATRMDFKAAELERQLAEAKAQRVPDDLPAGFVAVIVATQGRSCERWVSTFASEHANGVTVAAGECWSVLAAAKEGKS